MIQEFTVRDNLTVCWHLKKDDLEGFPNKQDKKTAGYQEL